MITVSGIIAFASVILLSTLKPGPGLLATVSRALSDGSRQGMFVAAGNATMHVAYFVLVCLAIGFAQNIMEFITILLKALGAVFMIYLGIKEFMKLEAPLIFGGNKRRSSFLENYMTGVSVCLANPLVIFLYAAIAPTFIPIEALNVADIILLSFIVFCMNFGGLSFLCLCAGRVRIFFKTDGNLKGVRVIVGTMFIFIGLIIGFSAMPFINWTEIYF